METQEIKQIELIEGEWHKKFLYVTKNFKIPVVSTFCGIKRTGIKRCYRNNTNATCPECTKMTLEDAIANIEKRIANKENLL